LGTLEWGCSLLVDEHVLTVSNESGAPVEGLVVGIKTREIPVERLAPGATTVVRMRFNAESHWDVYLLKPTGKKHLGSCGYTGTTPGRATEHTVHLVAATEAAARDCSIAVPRP
jgi:hypothetical protein